MSELANAIARLESFKTSSAQRDVSKHHLVQREMNKDRIEFVQIISDVARTWEQDARLNADPALKADFGTRFAEMRQTLSRHQAAWTAERMVAEPDEYQRSVVSAGKTLAAFIDRAKRAVQNTGS